MSLSVGARLGPYEILSVLGAGGMGAVYRARDTKLGRDVAVKALPDTLAADAERLRRVEPAVKVLDFGLAKAMEPASGALSSVSMSPTITTPAMTQAGMILGTAAYMSPEQAKGRPADKRSDMWAFGCVLYETLTGTRAFGGEDVGDTLANVLKTEPDWTAMPAATPPSVRHLLRRCLAKDRARRLSDAAAARLDIDEAP